MLAAKLREQGTSGMRATTCDGQLSFLYVAVGVKGRHRPPKSPSHAFFSMATRASYACCGCGARIAALDGKWSRLLLRRRSLFFFKRQTAVHALLSPGSCFFFIHFPHDRPECKGLKSAKVLATATTSKKNMKPLWKVKRFEQCASWNVRVPDSVFRNRYMNMNMYIYTLVNVCVIVYACVHMCICIYIYT